MADSLISPVNHRYSFQKSLCQTLAKQFLVKDSWHSFLEHLHPDKDERPFNPSASGHETPMEVDREVDVPPPALPSICTATASATC